MQLRTRRGLKLPAVAVMALLASLVLAACGGDDEGDAGENGDSSEPIVVGITTARSGALEPYDRKGSQMLQLRLEEINEEGGVLDGRQFEVEWLDTESDRARTGTNARQLIDGGADVIVATCDFDYAFPAMEVAMQQEVFSMAQCASAPIVADPATVGETGGSMGQGADVEAVAMADYLKRENPDWNSAYVFTDTFLQYNVQTSNYFEARWKELGGEICGTAEFVGDETLDVAPHITRLRQVIDECDVVYIGSIVPAGAQVLRAAREAGIDTPFATNVGVNGRAVREVAGRVSDFYTTSHRCLPAYCEGAAPEVEELGEKFEERWNEEMDESYAIVPYDLGSTIAAAIEEAGSTEGTEVANALFSGELVVDTLIGGPKVFTAECHRPQPARFDIERWTDGRAERMDSVTVEAIPDIDDGNTCLDVPPPPEGDGGGEE
jgi:branched-chain amino acid transport system substrate-binding protein